MIKYAIGIAALAAAGAVQAATTISFTGGGNTLTSGSLNFGSGITVQAAAYSYDGTTLERAKLGHYSAGLGVTNNNEDGSNNTHVIDNIGQHDFVLLVFNQAVNIASASLTPFDVSNDPNDLDTWVSYANMSGLGDASTIALNSSLWTLLNGVDYNINYISPSNPSSAQTINFNTSSGHFANVWVVGAANPNPDSNDDGFKLSSLSVTAAVPEPATWAMMLLGFGGIGLAVRRKRSAGLTQLA